ncbi:queuosine precursor transporter [bacterium]|nr:queuosine precursor transporter [bacterium]
MPNELLWLGFLLADLLLVLLVYRLFGRAGLIAYVVLSIITCNLQVLKLVELFGVPTTLGNILYGSIFFTTDLLSENYGKQAARQAVWIGFTAIILMTLFMQVALWFKPAPDDAMQPHMEMLFGFLPRVVGASLIAYLLSQLHDVWAFHWWKDRTKGRHLWIRNNASTWVSQLIDSTVFVMLAFAPLPILGSMPGFDTVPVLLAVWATTYIVKLIVAIIDTPFLYWGRTLLKYDRQPIG